MPDDRDDIPRTIKRSPEKAQRIWKETHDSAVGTYGEGGRAHRTAYAALKNQFEKVGDHWEPKKHRGPSDPRAAKPTAKAARGEGKTYGGLDYYGHTKAELAERARDMGIRVTSRMTKDQIATAIAKRQ